MVRAPTASEFFGIFDQADIKLLLDVGRDIIDPFGHRFLSIEDILPLAGSIDAIICDLEKVNKEVINAAPNLRIIARRGVGIGSVDYAYATQRGIDVARILRVLNVAIVELVFAYIFQIYRSVLAMNLDMHNRIWNKRTSHSLKGATIVILGMGNIGFELAIRAHVFDMVIQYHRGSINHKAEQHYCARKVTLLEIVGQSAILSIHLPLHEETRHVLSRENLKQMKNGSIPINTAMWALIDEHNLEEMIGQDHLTATTIDVSDAEPCMDGKLIRVNNAILTPHIGSFTREVYIRMDIATAQNVIAIWKAQADWT